MNFELTDHQIAQLDSHAQQQEAVRLSPMVRENFPELTQSQTDEQLQASIQAALARCSHWQVQTHAAMVDFVILWVLIGKNFDSAPEIAHLLNLKGTSIDTKIRALLTEFKWQLHLAGEN